MNIICPFCDSNDVEKIEITDSFAVPLCGDVVIPHTTFRCNNCGEEGDFDNSLDKTLTEAIDKANMASAPRLMDELSQNGITMTYLEKALRLPFRTTSRWKRGSISHSALALLRLIRFSPSLLEVADDNFSREATARYQISRTIDFFVKNTNNPSYALFIDENQLGLGFMGTVNSNPLPSIEPMQWELVT